MFKIIVSIFFIYSINLYSQNPTDSLDWILADSVIYESQKIPLPYPFQKLIDSAQAEFSKKAKKYYDEGAFCVHPPIENAHLFGFVNGRVVSLRKYLNDSKWDFLDNCNMSFEINIDWLGNVTKAKLKRYKGKLNSNSDYESFFSNLKAIPEKYSGIPLNSKMIIPIRQKTSIKHIENSSIFHHTIQFSDGKYEEPELDKFRFIISDTLEFDLNYDFNKYKKTVPIINNLRSILKRSTQKKKRYFLIFDDVLHQPYFHTEGMYRLKIILELQPIIKHKKLYYGIKENEFKYQKEISYKIINGYFQYFRFRTLIFASLKEGKISVSARNNDFIWGNIYLKFKPIFVPEYSDYNSSLEIIVNDNFRAEKSKGKKYWKY